MTRTCLQVSHEVHIDAPVRYVWRTLTEDLTTWWHTVSRRGSHEASLDAFVGGQLLEGGGSGRRGGPAWGTVTGLCETRYLEMCGRMDLPAGVRGFLEVDLDGTASGTSLRITHRASGPWEATRWALATSGWALTAGTLRDVVEGRPA
ncbi:SRPBCC family protein [Ornithinimicrobium cerasi]|uniref:SRPBCC family protein n=1 Tax=Ornithinimicrobium cerasi TaxID=2248773 RepID=UPI000EFEB7CF|nr:SRPBCC domain-containing protein [Ornithinimicrobium cerasi]